mgnify:CR=1 FL=1
MEHILNDPWGLLALSFVIGSMMVVVVYAFVLVIGYLVASKPKYGATKMCDRELRRRLRNRV